MNFKSLAISIIGIVVFAPPVLASNLDSNTDRDKVVEMIANGYSVNSLLDLAKQSAETKPMAYRECLTQSDTIDRASNALRREIKKDIEPLTQSEVVDYESYLKSGGEAVLTKHYEFIYQYAADALKQKKENTSPSKKEFKKFFDSLSDDEKAAYSAMDRLPNSSVRKMVFPVSNQVDEMFRTMIFSLTTVGAADDNCRQYLGKKE